MNVKQSPKNKHEHTMMLQQFLNNSLAKHSLSSIQCDFFVQCLVFKHYNHNNSNLFKYFKLHFGVSYANYSN